MAAIKITVLILCLGITLGRRVKRQDEECVNSDTICEKYGDASLDIYCNDASTGVAEGCCLACQGHIGEHVEEKRGDDECTNGDDICKAYGDEDLDIYCNDASTGVPDVCCLACQGHIGELDEKRTVEENRDEDCTNADVVCELYDEEELNMYCNEPSTGVGEGCCLACQGLIEGERGLERQELPEARSLTALLALLETGKVIFDFIDGATFDPSDWWNASQAGKDSESLRKMITSCGEGADASCLIGKRVTCKGASGLGRYGAVVSRVNLNKNWIEVIWDDGDYPAWKTAKLCWAELPN